MEKLEFILKITGGDKNASFKWIDMEYALSEEFGFISTKELIDVIHAYEDYILSAA